jgi:putative peptide zinc metalloprotease protein
VELVGEFASSGYREPPQLIRRSDGQLVRLHPLLYQLAKQLDGRQPLPCLASALARETGVEVTADQVSYLVDKKLAPLGVSTYCDGSPPTVSKANSFLALRFRMAVLPEKASWVLGGIFGWLFQPVVLFVGVLATVISEGWLFTSQDMSGAVGQAIALPGSILMIVGLAAASTAFHEMGHASACRYSGVRPGKMGCGLYLIWPIFYTDITNSYRLSRGGRLRTDLGGIYFNGLFVVGLTVAYRLTGFTPLLAAVLTTNIEVLQQLMPAVRFDAYYIISDLIGIPDLFRYMGPIIKRTLLLRAPDERLRDLKRWPQVVIGVWMLAVVPTTLVELGVALIHTPRFVKTGEAKINTLLTVGHIAVEQRNLIGAGSAALQILFVLLPVAGVTLLALRALRGAVRFAARRLRGALTVLAPAPAAAGGAGMRAPAVRGRHSAGPYRGGRRAAGGGRHSAAPYNRSRRAAGRGRHSMYGRDLLPG